MFGIQGFFSTSEMDKTLDTARLAWPVKIFIVDQGREERNVQLKQGMWVLWFYGNQIQPAIRKIRTINGNVKHKKNINGIPNSQQSFPFIRIRRLYYKCYLFSSYIILTESYQDKIEYLNQERWHSEGKVWCFFFQSE